MARLIWLFIVLSFFVGGCARYAETPFESVSMSSIPQTPNGSARANLADGKSIADLMNKNYNENTTSCTEYGTGKTRGYYFCTGVLARSTDDGPFNPWESSPTALQLRATSYSWIRHDYPTKTFYKRAGFLLLSPADVLAGVVPGVSYPTWASTKNLLVMCVYPFDAHTTRTMNRYYYGCDFEGTGLGSPVSGYQWGSCDNKLNFTTAEQFNNYFRSQGALNYKQCSWNADNSRGWSNAIQSYAAFPSGQASWNEVMMFNGGPASSGNVPIVADGMANWIVAFFYDPARAGSLADAQSFQRKLASVKNKRVPILKLDFKAPAPQRFQFSSADQVRGYYP